MGVEINWLIYFVYLVAMYLFYGRYTVVAVNMQSEAFHSVFYSHMPTTCLNSVLLLLALSFFSCQAFYYMANELANVHK